MASVLVVIILSYKHKRLQSGQKGNNVYQINSHSKTVSFEYKITLKFIQLEVIL